MSSNIKRWDGSSWATVISGASTFSTGDLKASILTSCTGWLKMDGTAYANANVSYPDLFNAVPGAWKSGNTMTLPDMTDRVLMGGGTLGATGGANSRTIASANLPTHTHDIDHNHGSFTSGAGSSHTHDLGNHTHTSAAGAVRSNTGSFSNNDVDLLFDGGSNEASAFGTGIASAGPSTNTSGGESAHTHSINPPALGATNSGNGGFANTALDTTPAHLRINIFIKT